MSVFNKHAIRGAKASHVDLGINKALLSFIEASTASKIMMAAEHDDASDTDLKIRTKTREKTKIPPLYKVVMLNDDFTSVAFVVDVLKRHFNKDEREASQIADDVHRKGTGIAGVYSHEIAETKQTLVMDEARKREFPFKIVLEAQ